MRGLDGGYWIAKDDPQAAEEAVTPALPVQRPQDVVLLSNGVTRLGDPYRVATWVTLLELCRSKGPEEVLRVLREHEATATGSLVTAAR